MSAHRVFNPGPDDLIMADGRAWPAFEERQVELDAPRVPELLRLELLTDLGEPEPEKPAAATKAAPPEPAKAAPAEAAKPAPTDKES